MKLPSLIRFMFFRPDFQLGDMRKRIFAKCTQRECFLYTKVMNKASKETNIRSAEATINIILSRRDREHNICA